MDHKKFVETWKEYDGDLRPFLPLVECESDAWRAAALIAMLGKDKHQIKPQRKGWDCLAQNAKCVSIARFLAFRDSFPIKYDRDTVPFTFIKNSKFVDCSLKHSLSFEMSAHSMYAKTDVTTPYHLPLGAAIIQEQWKTRDGEDIMFGHIRTLVDAWYNRDMGYAVFLNGATNGPTSLVIVGDLPKDHEIPWTDYPHSLITVKELLSVREGDPRNKTWSGKLVFST